jgi:hypothetical protein
MKRAIILYIPLILFMSAMAVYKGDYFNPYRLTIMSLLWVAMYIALSEEKPKAI